MFIKVVNEALINKFFQALSLMVQLWKFNCGQLYVLFRLGSSYSFPRLSKAIVEILQKLQ